jgi:hypothetical protein
MVMRDEGVDVLRHQSGQASAVATLRESRAGYEAKKCNTARKDADFDVANTSLKQHISSIVIVVRV